MKIQNKIYIALFVCSLLVGYTHAMVPHAVRIQKLLKQASNTKVYVNPMLTYNRCGSNELQWQTQERDNLLKIAETEKFNNNDDLQTFVKECKEYKSSNYEYFVKNMYLFCDKASKTSLTLGLASIPVYMTGTPNYFHYNNPDIVKYWVSLGALSGVTYVTTSAIKYALQPKVNSITHAAYLERILLEDKIQTTFKQSSE